MKHIYTLVFTVLFTISLAAQDAPDFTVTDTHGNVHSLYADYLDKGKTVVLDLFFVNCPPCNDLAPLLEPVYQEWGAGTGDVQFFSLTSDFADTDEIVLGFEERHGTTWPAASAEGGGPAAQQPYTLGEWGEFYGYPTLIVISPDRSVQFDAWGDNLTETLTILDEWITSTGALKSGSTSTTEEVQLASELSIYPNPVEDRIFFNTAQKIDKYEISTIDGKSIMSASITESNINVAQLNEGLYILRLHTNEGLVLNKKFNKL